MKGKKSDQLTYFDNQPRCRQRCIPKGHRVELFNR